MFKKFGHQNHIVVETRWERGADRQFEGIAVALRDENKGRIWTGTAHEARILAWLLEEAAKQIDQKQAIVFDAYSERGG